MFHEIAKFSALELRPQIPFNHPSPEKFCSTVDTIRSPFSYDICLGDGEVNISVASEHPELIANAYAHIYEGLGTAPAPLVPSCVARSLAQTDYAAGVVVTATTEFASSAPYAKEEDRLTPLLTRLSALKAKIWIQTLVEPARLGLKARLYRHSLELEVERARLGGEKPSRMLQAAVDGAEGKMLQPVFRVSVRSLAFAPTKADAVEAARCVGCGFEAFRGPEGALKWDTEDPRKLFEHMLKRRHLHRFVLSSVELCSPIRLPSPFSLSGMNVKRAGLRLQPIRPRHEGLAVSLGTFLVDGKRFDLPLSAFLAHALLLGATGFGKSTLILRIIHALQHAGWSQRTTLATDLLDRGDLRGISLHLAKPSEAFTVIVIDVEGELSKRLLRTSQDLPVDYYHPDEAPFAYNPLEVDNYASAEERDAKVTLQAGNVAASIAELTGLTERWSPRMLAILRKSLTALMRAKDRATLSELRELLDALSEQRLLEDKVQRLGLECELAQALRGYCDMWPRISESIFGLQYRLDVFLDSKMMRRTFNSARSTLDFRKMLRPGSLTILDLGGLDIPPNFRQALASMLLWRVWLALVDRSKVVEEKRLWPVIVVADEFQMFSSISLLPQIVAEMRKKQMFLYLANQNLAQLSDPLVATILANTGLQFFFNLSGDDSKRVAQNMDPVLAGEIMQTLVTLPKFQAMIRVKSEEEYVAPYLINCHPPLGDTYTDQQVHDALKVIKAERQRMIDEMAVADTAGWTHLVSFAPPPPPSLFRIVLAVWELQTKMGAPTLTSLSESSLGYVPKNKYTLSNVIERAVNGGYLRRVPVKGREAYHVTERAEAILFPAGDVTSTAKAGLDRHRALIIEAQWALAREGWYPIRTDESSAQPNPDGVIVPPHPFQDSWEFARAAALEAETYPEKHPDRVRWHVINDLRNLDLHSVIFAVDCEERKAAIEGAIAQLEENLTSRVEIRTVKL